MVGRLVVNVISAYAPQVGLDGEVKRLFWEDLDEVVRRIPARKKSSLGATLMGISGYV